jgi:DNA-binding SARP family transcriptional activator
MLVKQTTLSQNGSSLLDYAISRLRPEVFSHPIWVHFAKQEVSISLSLIEDLLCMAHNLQEHDQSAACQILLICAFYQNDAGQPFNALRTTQQAHALAERSGLSRETIWALWGACAISIQWGDCEQAVNYFMDLQTALNKQNEWIVANLIEVMKQSLYEHGMFRTRQHSASPCDRWWEDMLTITFDWLHQWGVLASIHEPEFEANLPDSKEGSAPDATSYNLDIGLKTEKVYGNYISGPAGTAIPVAVHMLGPLSMTIGDLRVKLPVSRGLSLFKYLLFHHKQSKPREVLMDIFWPDAEPEAARNNLNVALYNLRRALRTFTDLPVIVFEAGTYGLAPNLQVWLDVEEFERCVKAGQRLEARNQLMAAMSEYEAALSLYQGDFLEYTPYEEWTVLDRERLRIAYLDTLDRLSQIYFNQEHYAACITICQLTLNHDPCREDAHCLLMRCYYHQGQGYLALRQYQLCHEALHAELEVEPAPETRQLYDQIRCHGVFDENRALNPG